MDRRIDFSGKFAPAPLGALTPGSSYVGVRCRGCGLSLGIFEDIGQGEPIAFAGPALFRIECSSCGVAAEYGAGDLIQFTSAQGGAASTA